MMNRLRARARSWSGVLRRSPALFVAALIFVAGCGKAPPPTPAGPPKTGAEQAAKQYFEALLRKDWPAAYALLDSGSQSACGKAEFATLGRRYYDQIEFEPSEVNVSASETDGTASAIAVYRGVSGTAMKQFRDGTALQKTASGWVVTLRKNFGKDAPQTGKSGKG